MICVSLNEKTVNSTIKLLKKDLFFEVRLDLIENLDMKGLNKILNINKKIIVAFRPGKGEENPRIKYLLTAMDMHVKFVDIEFESDRNTIKEIVNKGKTTETNIIISYHNFKETPAYEDLVFIVNECRELGADIIKIATFIKEKQDNIKLLKLLEKGGNIVIAGMGEKGKVSRVMSVLLGSPFTYASVAKGKETAKGQIDFDKMEELLKELS